MKNFIKFWITVLFVGQSYGQEIEKNDEFFGIIENTNLSIEEIEKIGNARFKKDETGKTTVDTGRGSGYKQFQRFLYERYFHLNEGGYLVPPVVEQENYSRAVTDPENLLKAAAGTWTNDGPYSWNRTSGWNPGNGRLTTMAIHPSYPNTIYVGSPGGGVWKTTNGGSSWQPLTDYNSSWMNIYSLAIDPANANIIYAGTSSGVIFKSTNGGSSWSNLGTGPSGNIKKIVVHPSNSSIVFACAANGLWRSTNSGLTWTVTTGTQNLRTEDVEFKPGNPNTMYASGDYIWLSTDNGQTWQRLDSTHGISDFRSRILLAVTPNNPNVVYAVQASSNRNTFGKLYRSTNSGASYSTMVTGNTTGKNYFGYNTNGIDTRGQAYYDMAICVSPSNYNEVHIGGIITWKSTNGGTSFTATTEWSLPNSTGYNHADIHGLEFMGNTLYSLSDGGIYKSTNNASDWINISNGLSIRQFYRMGSSATDSNIYTGGAQDNGSVAKNASGYRDWLGADGMEGMVAPNNPNYIYGTSQNGQLYSSSNGGSTRSTLFNMGTYGGAWVTPFVMHPTSNSIIYSGANGIYKSTNGGSSFSKISGTSVVGTVSDLALSPSNPSVIYGCVGTKIYYSNNDGTNWYTYTSPKGSVTDIAVDPNLSNVIYYTTNNATTTGGRVFKLDVNTATTTDISGTLPKIAFRSIAIESTTGKIYAAGNIGVYASANNGTSWTNITYNLPSVAINEIDIQKSTGKLRVATYGRGIWTYSLSAKVASKLSSEDDIKIIDNIDTERNIFPNPATNNLNINIAKYDNIATIIISDIHGRVVNRIDNLTKLTNDILEVDIITYEKGVYIIQFYDSNGILDSAKFLKE